MRYVAFLFLLPEMLALSARMDVDLLVLQLSMPVLMYDKDGKSTVLTLEKLLPMSFGPENLKSPDELAHQSAH